MNSHTLRTGFVMTIIMLGFAALLYIVIVAKPVRRYHVTCPFGIFSGEVEERGINFYSPESGNRLQLPDNCVWERLP